MKIKRKWAKVVGPLLAFGLALGLGLSGKLPLDQAFTAARNLITAISEVATDEDASITKDALPAVPHGLPLQSAPQGTEEE